jgi:N-acetylmuramoyl-L-alanine amidase
LKKYFVPELLMALLLLISFYILARQAAAVSGKVKAEEEKVILVDAGHGGIDPGMIGVGDLEEKGINLAIAEKLKACLEKEGFTVVMTRETDTGLYDEGVQNQKVQDMQRRIGLIQQNQPLLAVSIHQNSYSQPEIKGPQVFYYADSTEGEKLAKLLQEELNTGLEVERPREAKGNTSYYLLKRSPCVLNIVECGFLTNPQEAELLQTEEYQEKVAEAVTVGIVRYLNSLS